MADSTSGNNDVAQQWPDWPAYALIDDLLPTLQRWVDAGQRYALATLIEVVGSAPRPVGSEMAICENGEIAGYVSGGCVEAAVATEALAALRDGAPRLLDYGAGSPVLDLQLTCGGRIRIFVRGIGDGAAHLRQLRDARRQRTALYARVELADGAMQYATTPSPSVGLQGAHFVQCYEPPLRLVIVGGDPVALSLLRLAPAFGLETVLLRPRGPARFPDSEPPPQFYDRRGIDTALAALQLDARCAIYTVSHDADTDHAVLAHALRSKAFCIGALGSRLKAQQRLDRLRDDGFDAATLARVHSPAGLNIGARTPQEIALSILGQVVADRSR